MDQVGVTHYPRLAGENTGASFRKILRTFRDIFKLRWKLWTDRSGPSARGVTVAGGGYSAGGRPSVGPRSTSSEFTKSRNTASFSSSSPSSPFASGSTPASSRTRST